jgi:hypothetical protein
VTAPPEPEWYEGCATLAPRLLKSIDDVSFDLTQVACRHRSATENRMATNHNHSGEESSSTGSDDGDDNWNDWVDDENDKTMATMSLFEDRSFPNPQAAIDYDKRTHSFDLSAIVTRLGWFSPFIRLVTQDFAISIGHLSKTATHQLHSKPSKRPRMISLFPKSHQTRTEASATRSKCFKWDRAILFRRHIPTTRNRR